MFNYGQGAIALSALVAISYLGIAAFTLVEIAHQPMFSYGQSAIALSALVAIAVLVTAIWISQFLR